MQHTAEVPIVFGRACVTESLLISTNLNNINFATMHDSNSSGGTVRNSHDLKVKS